jgi:hypothetical protein
MTKTSSVRNTVLVVLLGLIVLYTLFQLTGGKLISKNSRDTALQARAGLLDEVDTERQKQESEELDKIQADLDQTDLGALPQ